MRSVGFFPAKDIQHLGRTRCLFSRSLDWSSLLHIKIVKLHLVSWDLLPSHKLCYVATGLRKGSWKMVSRFQSLFTWISPRLKQCHTKGRLHIATFLFGFRVSIRPAGPLKLFFFDCGTERPTLSGKFTHL